MTTRKKVIFICTHTSARSQIAEGYLNARYGDLYEAYSAGTEASGLNSHATIVMAEKGIDISGAKLKGISEFTVMDFDIAVAVCDLENAACPMFPWAKETIHASFEDPSRVSGSEDEILCAFRKVRDEIFEWIDGHLGYPRQAGNFNCTGPVESTVK